MNRMCCKEGNTPLVLAARLDERWMVEVDLGFEGLGGVLGGS